MEPLQRPIMQGCGSRPAGWVAAQISRCHASGDAPAGEQKYVGEKKVVSEGGGLKQMMLVPPVPSNPPPPLLIS